MLTRVLHRLRDERGFTLIETLVAMVTGIIVTGALFAILEVSLHQSARLSDVAQATQLGRTSMNRVVDTMHSACIAEKFTPVQETSTQNKLVMISGYSEGAEIPTKATTTTGVHLDEFEWNSTTKNFTDVDRLSSAETGFGKYTWQTPTTFRLGENINRTGPSEEEPIFRYYEYATTPSTSTTAASSTLKLMPLVGATTELGANAKKVASVAVEFTQLPVDKSKKVGRPVTLNSQVTFAFAAPDSESTIEAGPCE
jgi:Tfp pilus assembly protein PilV